MTNEHAMQNEFSHIYADTQLVLLKFLLQNCDLVTLRVT